MALSKSMAQHARSKIKLLGWVLELPKLLQANSGRSIFHGCVGLKKGKCSVGGAPTPIARSRESLEASVHVVRTVDQRVQCFRPCLQLAVQAFHGCRGLSLQA